MKAACLSNAGLWEVSGWSTSPAALQSAFPGCSTASLNAGLDAVRPKVRASHRVEEC